jgi:ElaB/YqjD/DUF883 family membrane-anchored ribosome-binding protein
MSNPKQPTEPQEIFDYVKKVAGEGGQEFGKKISKATHDVEEFVKEHPLTSVAIAAGIGYLIARLFNRRDS